MPSLNVQPKTKTKQSKAKGWVSSIFSLSMLPAQVSCLYSQNEDSSQNLNLSPAKVKQRYKTITHMVNHQKMTKFCKLLRPSLPLKSSALVGVAFDPFVL